VSSPRVGETGSSNEATPELARNGKPNLFEGVTAVQEVVCAFGGANGEEI
jgi:hypothetical protein